MNPIFPPRSYLRNLFLSGLPIFKFWPRSFTPFPFVNAVLSGHVLNIVDVGARGDVQPAWLALDGAAHVFAFEPDIGAVAEMRSNFDRRGNGGCYTIINVGVAARAGSRTLYSSGTSSGASVLPMTGNTWKQYGGGEHDEARNIEISVETLSDALLQHGCKEPHMIKLDIQGLELEVLESIPVELRSSIVCLEFEVMVQNDGIRPMLADYIAFLDKNGFDIFDFRTHRAPLVKSDNRTYHEDVFGVDRPSKSISERLWELDIIAFRRVDDVLSRGDAGQVHRLAATLCTYNYFAEARSLIERASKSNGIVSQMSLAAIVGWHDALRRRTADRIFPGFKFLRHVAKVIRLGDGLRWSRSQWLGYPSA